MANLCSIEQMRDRARRRLPRFAFDFIDGGAGREGTLRENVAAFERLKLVPRVLTGAGQPTAKTQLFGRDYAAPIGIAPMGLPAMAWPGADLGLAHAAARAGIPYVVSTAASVTVEEAVRAAPGVTWFQLYPARDAARTQNFVERIEGAGIEVLVLTVDRPVMGWRVRDLTNGVALPFKPNWRVLASLAGHPGWSLATWRAGAPRIANPDMIEPPGAATANGASAGLDWAFFAMLRALWKGKLVVKGILHPEDARRAVEAGADGVIVSNHGGAHLESAPASIDRLRLIRDAVGSAVTVLLDGGVRSGEDVAKALVLGADFVLLGRPFVYGIAALGPADGPARVIEIFRETFTRALTLLGCQTSGDLNLDHISS